MAELPPYPGTPRWVKVFGIIALAVVLLVGAMMRAGGGPDAQAPAASVTQGEDGGGHTPPVGGHQ